MVREALADAVPRERMRVERARPRLEPAVPFIDAILEDDLQAPLGFSVQQAVAERARRSASGRKS
jgi:hypothetical protein